jgi:hypothetical protein
MAGSTVTEPGAALTRRDRETTGTTVTEARAARELGLTRSEFRLATQLGRIRTVPDPPQDPGQPPSGARSPRLRVTRAEIDRLQAMDGFPEPLRAAVRTVSATQGARELGITTTRFTRLARLGHLAPVSFYVNRYRTVVWLYLAQELARFAASGTSRPLLEGRLSATLKARLDQGTDLRARNWRERYLTYRLRLTDDPWTRAAAAASLLDEDDLADAVPDPYERAHLLALGPARPRHGLPGAPVTDPTAELLTADDPEEILRLKRSLTAELARAGQHHPASPADGAGRDGGEHALGTLPATGPSSGPPAAADLRKPAVPDPPARPKHPGTAVGDLLLRKPAASASGSLGTSTPERPAPVLGPPGPPLPHRPAPQPPARRPRKLLGLLRRGRA